MGKLILTVLLGYPPCRWFRNKIGAILAIILDQETVDFPLNPEWKIVKIKLHMDDMKDSIQSYIVDTKNNRSALIEINNKKIPVSEWYWFVGAPNVSF